MRSIRNKYAYVYRVKCILDHWEMRSIRNLANVPLQVVGDFRSLGNALYPEQ